MLSARGRGALGRHKQDRAGVSSASRASPLQLEEGLRLVCELLALRRAKLVTNI